MNGRILKTKNQHEGLFFLVKCFTTWEGVARFQVYDWIQVFLEGLDQSVFFV